MLEGHIDVVPVLDLRCGGNRERDFAIRVVNCSDLCIPVVEFCFVRLGVADIDYLLRRVVHCLHHNRDVSPLVYTPESRVQVLFVSLLPKS